MKETIKHYFPLLLTALCAVFSISFLFSSFSDVGYSFSNITQKDYVTSVAKQAEAQLNAPFPTPKYIGNTLNVGDAYSFENLFLLEFSDGTTTKIKEQSGTSLYLVDIKLHNDDSVLTELSSADIDHLEMIPSAVIYDTENHLLYFHNHGIYKFYIRLYYNHRPGVLFECLVPVETR